MGRVLLVSPDPKLQAAFRASPLLTGHDVASAFGALVALGWLRRHSCDVIVTSPATSLEEDLTFLAEARRARPGVRAVTLSLESTPEQVIAALRAEVFACFTAPFDASEVIDMTVRALDNPGEWKNGIEVVSAHPDWLTLRVNCRIVTAERLVNFLDELARELPEPDRDGLMFAFREVLVNAMEHGGRFDPDQVVDVSAIRTVRTLVFYVKDPGAGFDPKALAHAALANPETDPLAHVEERARQGLRPGGFGLLLARRIVDELIWSQRGNEVLLIKYKA